MKRFRGSLSWLFEFGRWPGIMDTEGEIMAFRWDKGMNYQVKCRKGIWLVNPQFIKAKNELS